MPSMLIHFNHILSPGTDESCDICRQSVISFIRTDDKELFERDIAKMATVHYAAGHGEDAEVLSPAPLEEIEIMRIDDNAPKFWATKTLRLNAEQHRRQFDHFYWNRKSAIYCMYRTPPQKSRAPLEIPSPASFREGLLVPAGRPASRSAAGPSSSAFSSQPAETAPPTGKQFSPRIFSMVRDSEMVDFHDDSSIPSPSFHNQARQTDTILKQDNNQQPQHTNTADRAQNDHGSKKAVEPKPAHPANQNGLASLFHPQQPSQAWPPSQPSVSAPGKPQQTTKLQEAGFSMPCRRRSLQYNTDEQTLAAAFRAGQTLPQQHKVQQGPVTTTAAATKGLPSKTRPEAGDRNVKKLPRSGMRKSVPVNNTFSIGNGESISFGVSPAGSPQKVVQQQHAESRHPLAAEPLYADSDEPMRDASGYDVFDGRSGWGCGN